MICARCEKEGPHGLGSTEAEFVHLIRFELAAVPMEQVRPLCKLHHLQRMTAIELSMAKPDEVYTVAEWEVRQIQNS